jgi:hypothetical protein
MAVTVTDTRTTITEADSATGWNTGSAGTTVFAEAPNSVISTLNIATGQIYFTTTSRDVSNMLIYVWADNFALKSVWDATNPPCALHLGDGTDRISFKMSGSNRKVFAHLASDSTMTVDWECLVLDGSQANTMNSAGYTTVRAGSFANLNMAAITQFGVDFTTLSKGLGGGVNVAVDAIRIGNDGLIVTGGTTGDRGTFLEIVNEDKSTDTAKAYGIIREYTTDLYGLQGPLTFGSATTATSWFEDSNVTLVFENRNISNDKYYLKVVSNSVGGANFILRNSTIATAGPFVTCDFSAAYIDTLTITDCTFRNLGNSITFSNGAQASAHTITGNVFDACGQIDPGDVMFQNNTISNSTASTTGAVLLDADGTSAWSNLNFVSGGTGHAIYITAAGTYTFDNFTYSGYGSTGTTNAVIYNNSGGAVTINVSGGDVPTYRNGTSASTTVVASVPISVTVIDTATNPIQNAQVAIFLTNTGSQVVNQDTDVNGEVASSFSGTTPTNIYIRVRKSSTGDTKYIPVSSVGTITSTGFSITFTLREDPNA